MTAFERRLLVRRDELEWLYMELYNDREGLEALEEMMAGLYAQRGLGLRRLDNRREQDPHWFRRGDMLGMTMYTVLVAGILAGLEKKLDYFR